MRTSRDTCWPGPGKCSGQGGLRPWRRVRRPNTASYATADVSGRDSPSCTIGTLIKISPQLTSLYVPYAWHITMMEYRHKYRDTFVCVPFSLVSLFRWCPIFSKKGTPTKVFGFFDSFFGTPTKKGIPTKNGTPMKMGHQRKWDTNENILFS